MKHFIFDFDGVLADSMPTWAGIYVDLLKKSKICPPFDMVKQITPLGNTGAAKYCIEHGLNMQSDEILSYTLSEFKKAYMSTVQLKAYVKETLSSLYKSGIHLHVLTASSHSYVDEFLKKHEIFELFDNVWSSDDFSLTKANPEIYIQAAKKLEADLKDCTFFDDNILALSTAACAGMTVVGVYDASSANLKDEILKITDKYIYDFSQITF